MTRIKICGIKNGTDRDCAVFAGADAVGFVVEIPRSRRNISRKMARSLIKAIPPFASSAIVIEPESVKEAAELALDTGANVIQVHGTLSPEELKTLKEMIPQGIVAAVGVDPSGASVKKSIDVARKFAKVADALLLDTFSGGFGGTGEVHDWEFSATLVKELDIPVILAGGLSPVNVAEAVRKVNPYAVDVSSGVETDGRNDGKKDCEKIKNFIKEVKSCPPQ